MRVGLLTPSPLGALLSAEGLLVSMQINATQIWRKRGSPGHLIHFRRITLKAEAQMRR